MNRLIPERLGSMLRAKADSGIELPPDVLRDARGRVRAAAASGTVAYAAFLAFELTGAAGGGSAERSIDLRHDWAGLGLCGLLWLASALKPVSDRLLLRLAIATEVMVCALVSFGVTAAALQRTQHVNGLTWVVPIVILFPLLVPFPPWTTLVVSALCVSTTPIAMAAVASRGPFAIGPSDYWSAAITGVVAAGIAVMASHTVYRAARQVAAARRIGAYELLEPLGHGGMGDVWKARHLLLARPAAVKRIRPETLQGSLEARAEATERFTREARITATLRSPHTVELFDFGESTDGTFYYAMELLDGMNLEHFVYRYGAIEPRRAVAWLAQACHSLGEAHALNLVHRDVKPANIVLCRYGRDRDFVKILDFGLTRPVDATADAALTGAGVRVGTPGYMSPEQVFGLPGGPRSDLYSLGCVAYFLLAGEKPFDADTPAELLRLHAQAPPPPLAGRTRTPVPPRLDAVVMACLAKDPNDRPADADRVREALESSLDAPPWTAADAQEWWARHPE